MLRFVRKDKAVIIVICSKICSIVESYLKRNKKINLLPITTKIRNQYYYNLDVKLVLHIKIEF